MLIRIKKKNFIYLLPITLACLFSLTFILSYLYPEATENEINLNELFHYGSCLLEQAGRKVVEIRENNQLDIRNKNDRSLVTKADLASHQIIVDSLKTKFKNLIIRSEEDSKEHVETVRPIIGCSEFKKNLASDIYVPLDKITVWVDPLDATIEYTENLIEYVTLMFCIAINGEPKAGIIYSPFSKQNDWSFINGSNSIKHFRKENSYKNDTNIIISRSHAGSVENFIRKHFDKAKIIKAAGSGYKGLKIAYQEADLYLHTTKIKKWDICAVNAILNNLNGKLTDINGQIIDYSKKSNEYVNGLIASLAQHEYFIKKLNE